MAIKWDNKANALVTVSLILAIIYIGRFLFIPIAFSILVSFVIYPWVVWLESRKIYRSMAILTGLLIITIFFAGLFMLLYYQSQQLVKHWPQLKESLENITFTIFGSETNILEMLNDLLNNQLMPILPQTLYQTSLSIISILLIPIYTFMMLKYRENWARFIKSIIPEKFNHHLENSIPAVILIYANFIKGMILVYIIVGILNSIGLASLGIPNPVFFGFIASILTFIPYVGISIGALLPMTIGWLHFGQILYPIGVIVIFTIVQFLEAYIIFPYLVGQRLQLNTFMSLVIILAGGVIWGGAGLILFLPFAGILKLLAEKIPEWKPIVYLIGNQKNTS